METVDEKKLESSNSSCKNCGGALVFNPQYNALWCANCDSKFEFVQTKNFVKHSVDNANDTEGYDEWKSQNKICKCKTCGANVILNGLEFTGVCPYCASNYVSEASELPGLKPDCVIPFAFNPDEAGRRFMETVRHKFFVPRNFKKHIPAGRIHGLYIPSFVFDADSSSVYTGKLDKVTYTTTKNGRQAHHHYFNISGTQYLSHRDMVVESSSKLNDKDLRGILPYDLEKSYNFTQDYLRGYVVEHYDDDLDTCFDVVKTRVKPLIKSSILSKYDYTNVCSLNINTDFSNKMYSYRLLPMYTIEFDYKNKKYMVFQNGQTGKVGKGLPKSVLKISAIVLFFVIIFTIIIILNLL